MFSFITSSIFRHSFYTCQSCTAFIMQINAINWTYRISNGVRPELLLCFDRYAHRLRLGCASMRRRSCRETNLPRKWRLAHDPICPLCYSIDRGLIYWSQRGYQMWWLLDMSMHPVQTSQLQILMGHVLHMGQQLGTTLITEDGWYIFFIQYILLIVHHSQISLSKNTSNIVT